MTEREKYDKIYQTNLIAGYGHSNCGKGFLSQLKNIQSLVDVGCGHNQFSKDVKKQCPAAKTIGVDFSCPSADVIASADSLPFQDKEFEWLTSFDMLEHLLPEDVDKTLMEMKRVSKNFAFSIAYRDSVYRVDGLTLHPTVKDEKWWTEKIKSVGGDVKKHGRYLYGEWGRKLTIGMVVYDDWDGFYFTIQSLRMYHKEAMQDVEFIVINTNPNSLQGKEVAKFCRADWIKEPLHYYEDDNERGTATRDKIFSYAKTPYVLVIDCHVMIDGGAIKRLINFFDSKEDDGNLLQGPILYDHLLDGPCKFNEEWRAGMYGTWGYDKRSLGKEPFEIPAQGLALFSCRKNSWLGFNKNHSGFGGEEGTIHEKFRQADKRTLCLPWLKFLHRFQRPKGVPYPTDWESRFKNYVREFIELNKPIFEVIEHFKTIGISETKLREWLSTVTNNNG